MTSESSLRFHPEAVEEIEAAFDWYQRRSPVAAQRFLKELRTALRDVEAAPERWPVYEHGTRRLGFAHFPFAVVYHIHYDVVEIVAIAHAKRKLAYWRPRLKRP